MAHRKKLFNSLIILIYINCFYSLVFSQECKIENNHISFDVAYLTPIGFEVGLGGGPVKYLNSFLSCGIIGFKTGTDLDKTTPGVLKMSGFYTWSFGARFRFNPFRIPKEKRSFISIGWTLRSFPDATGNGDALDCIYCSTWGRSLDMKPHQYLTVGSRYGYGYLSFDYRITNHKGTASYWGYDPYGLGAEWRNTYTNINTPKIIIRLSLYTEGYF
jgi:hypothetical protein